MITTYTVKEIKLAAFNQSEPPENMDLAEQVLFLTLSDIYRRWRSAEIGKSEGDALFKAAAQQFTQNQAKLIVLNNIAEHNAYVWKEIESAAHAYTSSTTRTPEADAFVEAVYQCKLKQKGSDANDS